MELARICPVSAKPWTPLRDSLLDSCHWESPLLHFPLSESRWLGLSVLPFVALFPLLDTGARLARGGKDRLRSLIERFCADVDKQAADDEDAPGEGSPSSDEGGRPSIDLPDLDNYTMIRAGKWYQILARDNFTCCACGRSAAKHGVVLHVDHIVPRSKGGTDDASNLQTLCLKCNLGKSNRDQTRLTSAE
jgi:hypothetical protein